MPCNDPILIGSCGSSGSTVLSVMLDAHPEIVSGPELALFAHPFFWSATGGEWRERLLRHLDEGYEATFRPEWTLEHGYCPYAGLTFENTLPWYGHSRRSLAELVGRCEDGCELAAAIYDPVLAERGKARWAEKSPQNVYAFRAFLDAYPDGRVVYLTRDPRDTVSSLMRKNWGGFKRSLAFWLLDTAICDTFRADPRVHWIRYEDLVREPQATVGGLLEFLEVAPEVDHLLDFPRTSARAVTPDASSAGDPSWRRQPTEPLGDNAIGAWKGTLSPEQLACLRAATIVGPVFGYPDLSGRTVPGLIERLGYEPIEDGQPDVDAVVRLVEREGLFLSAGDCASGAGASPHEAHVECDPGLLPGREADWIDRRFRAKLGRAHAVLAETQAGLQAVEATNDALQAELRHIREDLHSEIDDLHATIDGLRSAIELLQAEQERVRRHPIVRIVTRLQRLPHSP